MFGYILKAKLYATEKIVDFFNRLLNKIVKN